MIHVKPVSVVDQGLEDLVEIITVISLYMLL